MNKKMKKLAALTLSIGIGISSALTVPVTEACSRALYTGDNNVVVTGRTMDWMADTTSKIWVSPRGVNRDGDAGDNSINWKSKYGSVYVSAFDTYVVDGINEKGLVVNLLYLANSDVGQTNGKPGLNINGWAQYILDNYKDVNDAVQHLQKEPFRLVPSKDAASPSTIHVSISDSSGDSAIFEYINGELKIYHSKDYKVMTNEPEYSQQLAINEYWQKKDGVTFLPGSPDPADRFTRLSFMLNSLPQNLSKDIESFVPNRSYDDQAVLSVMSIMRGVSEPLPFTIPNRPNIASTLWRTVYDQKNMEMYYDSANSLNVLPLNIKSFDFSEGNPTLMLDLSVDQHHSNNLRDDFKAAPPLKYSK